MRRRGMKRKGEGERERRDERRVREKEGRKRAEDCTFTVDTK